MATDVVLKLLDVLQSQRLAARTALVCVYSFAVLLALPAINVWLQYLLGFGLATLLALGTKNSVDAWLARKRSAADEQREVASVLRRRADIRSRIAECSIEVKAILRVAAERCENPLLWKHVAGAMSFRIRDIRIAPLRAALESLRTRRLLQHTVGNESQWWTIDSQVFDVLISEPALVGSKMLPRSLLSPAERVGTPQALPPRRG